MIMNTLFSFSFLGKLFPPSHFYSSRLCTLYLIEYHMDYLSFIEIKVRYWKVQNKHTDEITKIRSYRVIDYEKHIIYKMILIVLLFIIVKKEHFKIVSTYGFRNDHARTKIFLQPETCAQIYETVLSVSSPWFSTQTRKRRIFKMLFNILFINILCVLHLGM